MLVKLCFSATDTGRLFMCGDGSFGQLGTGNNESHSSPIEISFSDATHVEQVACGMRHSIALVKGKEISLMVVFYY